ncbi:MAG TPA: peptidylprolyl isomerase [Roseiflexaceae bacterium]|nr:peptidylprolyl isomerase [Roseiflexaceae bacterium]
MTQAKSGDTVAVHYTGTLSDGTVFDSSRDRDPLTFTLGAGQVIPGFEDAVRGMQPGETRTTTIPAGQAYGERDEDLVFEVERSHLPPNLAPEVGEQYQMRQQDGQTIVVTVQDVSPDHVTFDANHPLAGQDLTFDLELVSIS